MGEQTSGLAAPSRLPPPHPITSAGSTPPNPDQPGGPVEPGAWAVPTAADMDRFGRRLAGVLRAGDLVLLDGALGAGKTALTQGIGAGLAVAGPVLSPTFVLSRVHPSLAGGPALVHVDAYRLSGPAEVDDLDLEATMDEAVTVVEWGVGLAEHLSADRLDVRIARSGDPADETRWVTLAAVGERWAGTPWPAVLGAGGSPPGPSRGGNRPPGPERESRPEAAAAGAHGEMAAGRTGQSEGRRP